MTNDIVNDTNPCDDTGSDGVTPVGKLCGLGRELRWLGRRLPGRRSVEPGAPLEPAALMAAIDRTSVAAMIRYGRAADLAREPCAGVLVGLAAELGLAPLRLDAPTLADLGADLSGSTSAAYAELRPEARPACAGEVTAVLAHLCARTMLPPQTRLEPIFANPAAWAALRSDVLAAPGPVRKPQRSRSLAIIERRASQMIEAARFTRTFPAALAEAMTAAGVSLDALVERSGVDYANIRAWLSGSQPRPEYLERVARIEQILGLRCGTLADLVAAPGIRMPGDGVLTPELRQRLECGSVPTAILGQDWATIDDAEKLARVAWLDRHILHGSPYRRYSRELKSEESGRIAAGAGRVLHQPLPTILAREFAAALEFKTTSVPDSDFPRVKTRQLGGRTIQNGGTWRADTTAPLIETHIRRLLTPLRNRGNDMNTLGAGFLINASVLRRLTFDIAERRFALLMQAKAFTDLGVAPPANKMVFTVGDADRLLVLSGLFNTETGYWYHNRPVLNRLVGGPDGRDLIGADWLARADADWPSLVRAERQRIVDLAKSIAASAARVRDPWFPIEPILDLPAPMQALYDGLDRMEADRPSYFGSPHHAARHDRDHLMMSLQVALRVRRKNYALKYTQDRNGRDIGHLRWQPHERQWHVVIPQSELKNRASTALPRDGSDLVIILDPGDTRLYRAIDRWLDGPGCSRRIMHGDDPGPWLFPGMRDGPLGDRMTSEICYAFSARYIAGVPWRDGGMPGVLPFGPHTIRDIVATHALKVTGSPEYAANVLFDTLKTIETRYARILSKEKSQNNNRLIAMSIARPADPWAGRP